MLDRLLEGACFLKRHLSVSVLYSFQVFSNIKRKKKGKKVKNFDKHDKNNKNFDQTFAMFVFSFIILKTHNNDDGDYDDDDNTITSP